MPSEEQNLPAAQHLAPAWKVGDTWTVRYRVLVPSMLKMLNPPPEFEASQWRYTVDDCGAEAVQISAQRDESNHRGPRTWHFTFAPNGRLLSVRDPWHEAPFDSVADTPVISLDDFAQRVGAEAWPRFPLEEDFGLDDSDLRQRSHSVGSDLEVTIARAGRRIESDLVRTATQRWEAGRPWWSILRIVAEYTSPEEIVTTVQIEGEVIAWPASTP